MMSDQENTDLRLTTRRTRSFSFSGKSRASPPREIPGHVGIPQHSLIDLITCASTGITSRNRQVKSNQPLPRVSRRLKSHFRLTNCIFGTVLPFCRSGLSGFTADDQPTRQRHAQWAVSCIQEVYIKRSDSYVDPAAMHTVATLHHRLRRKDLLRIVLSQSDRIKGKAGQLELTSSASSLQS